MSRPSFSTKHIEYLGKDFLDDYGGRIDFSTLQVWGLGEVRLLKILGLANFWEMSEGRTDTLRVLMEDLISGLHEAGIPLIFGVFGKLDRIEITLGTFSDEGRNAEDNLKTLKTVVRGSFHGVEVEDYAPDYLRNRLQAFSHLGLLTGTPKERLESDRVQVEQIERIIRGLYGREFGYLVAAKPMRNYEINDLYNSVLNEMRLIGDYEKSVGAESPIGGRYRKLLDIYINKLQLAKAQGMWHTAIYLLASDVETRNHVKALAKTVFGGRESLPDRIRVFDIDRMIQVPALIRNMAPFSPGQFIYPYSLMSSLNSNDLANFIHLPSQEMPGFNIKPYARFNVSPGELTKEGSVNIGEIIDQGNRMGINYSIPINNLRKHGLIVGTTGSGKTNTIFYMLKEAWKLKLPFLVIEPAKTEYRSLLYSDEMGKDISVYTLGDNNVSPFRINPFEIFPGVPVQSHIDHLKSVFNASFYMWGILPQILERCIHEIYLDKGWDLTSNANRRGLHRNSSPTLTDLYNKIDEVVESLGYTSESSMEFKSALKTRINSLRIGGKGLMLDTRYSIPFKSLITRPTILELESIGDDEEKSFIMGLVLTAMYEYYVSQGLSEAKGLEHITVLEEAHRLLGSTQSNNPYVGNLKEKAVETFVNMLSEIRAYGEGFLIAEQIPMKLASDVIKNTSLKIMHRVVAEDDRRIMGTTMNLDERGTKTITSLNVGEAAVYGEGDDGAFHVKVPYSKIEAKKQDKVKENETIRKIMEDPARDAPGLAPFEGCTEYCQAICRHRSIGNRISQDHRFTSQMPTLILSLVDDVAEQILPQFIELGEDAGRRIGDPKAVKTCAIVQGAEIYFENLGSKYEWAYEDVESLKEAFLALYVDSLEKYYSSNGSLSILDDSRLLSFRSLYSNMCMNKQPTKYCGEICTDTSCLYRFNLDEALADESYHKRFMETIHENGENMWRELNDLCTEAAEGVILPYGSDSATKKIALCFALHKSQSIESFTGRHVQTIMRNLMDTSNSEQNDDNEEEEAADTDDGDSHEL